MKDGIAQTALRLSKRALVFGLFFTFALGTAAAHDDDLVLNHGSDLRDWCRAESEARFIGAGKTPYNWTALYQERGNVLEVNGSWRVDGADVAVQCRAARGARVEYATVRIGPG